MPLVRKAQQRNIWEGGACGGCVRTQRLICGKEGVNVNWEDFLRSSVLGAPGAACGANKKCSELKQFFAASVPAAAHFLGKRCRYK